MVKSTFREFFFNMHLKQCFAFLFLTGALYGQLPLRQDPKDVVATVDGRDITRGELREILFVAGPQFANLFQSNPQLALYQWFLKQHLGKEGAELKLDQQSPLKEQIEALRMEYLADARINLEMNAYQLPDGAMERYYNQNITRYQRVRVSGVFLKFKPKDGQGTGAADLAAAAQAILSAGQQQRTEDEARVLALDIVKRVRAGEDMAKLAAQYSDDPASKAKGGDIGYVSGTSEFPAEFKAAVLGLVKGTVSDPIRLTTGFFVVRADEKGAQPFQDAAADISTELKKVHLDEFMKALNERFRPVIKDQTLIVQPATQAR
jgi:peptidyl-prolyl cis-trans isomerase C